MAQRTGVPTILRVAQEMCRLIVKFTPVIQKLYGTNTTLMAALEAANVACGVLVAELAVVRELGD